MSPDYRGTAPEPTLERPGVAFSISSTSSANDSHEVLEPRLGQLRVKSRSGVDGMTDDSMVIETPELVRSTHRGALPHLTPDNLLSQAPHISMLHLALQHFCVHPDRPPAFVKAPFGLLDYIGLGHAPKRHLLMMGLREADDETILTPNGDRHVTIPSHRGTHHLKVSDLTQYSLSRPVDILLSVSDQPTHYKPGNNRLKNSLDRSLDWLREVIGSNHARTSIFAEIVGSPNLVLVKAFCEQLSLRTVGSTEETLDDHLSGYAFHLAPLRKTLPVFGTDHDSNGGSMAELMKTAFESLKREKCRAVLGARGPHEILRLVKEIGIDLFVDDWSSDVSSAGVELCFEFGDQGDQERTAETPAATRPIGLNLFEERFATDFTALSFATDAQPITRAYIHHLLHTHEMSAHVFLAIHNHQVMSRFTSQIRTTLSRGRQTFLDSYERFCETYEQVQPGDDYYEFHLQAKEMCARVKAERGKGRTLSSNQL